MPINLLSRLTFWRVAFGAILAAGLYATFVRFTDGLGSATDLSDGFPWGLWIGFDVLVGVGLAAGGFVIAATVHVFRLERFESIARPAVLTAFLGYLLVIVALLFDLGRPFRIWHPLVMWNPHSVMFEVGWCVTLYTTVLMLEFSPLVLERFGLKAPMRLIRSIYVPLVIIGVLLSVLHQSSLGTFYVIAPDKLHGLWYTPLLPVFFLISAIAAGLAMTIFESFLSYRAFKKHLELSVLQDIGRVIVVVLGLYAVWKLEDLAGRGNLGMVFQVTPESALFWGEMGLGVLLPMLLFAIPKVRRDPSGLFLASILTVMGFVVGRLNVSITGMAGSAGASYFPTWMEMAVTTAIVAAGFFLFGLAVKHLPVFPVSKAGEDSGTAPATGLPVLRPAVIVVLWTLLLVGFVTVGFSSRTAGRNSTRDQTVSTASAELLLSRSRPATELALPEEFVFPQGESSPGEVSFRHETHVEETNPDCSVCHSETYPILATGGGVTDGDTAHALCGGCHDGERAFLVDEGCEYCHQ